MLSVYTETGHGKEALLLFREMVMKHAEEGDFHVNGLSFVIALEACSLVAKTEEEGGFPRKDQVSIDIVRAIHSDVANTKYASDVMVMTALVCMYGKCGDFLEAEYIFFSSLEPNIVSWTVMLSLYTAGGESENALWLYQHMLSKEVGMSDMTLVCVLQACSGTGSLGISQEVHFSLTSAGYDTITFVSPTLIHAYGSCARMLDAQALFYSIPRPSLEAWNACIGNGDILKSIRMFERLKLGGIDPDGVTFVALLSACSHGGLVTDGHRYFELMNRNHGIRPDIKHYGCFVDLVGRAGNIEKAYSFLMRMPKEADFTTWLCLLGACCVHGNCIEVATEAFKKVLSIEPEHGVAYILMSNAYVLG
jgi:pentatricopeptide repeat protein